MIIEILQNNEYQIFSKAKKEGIVKSSVLEGFEVNLQEIMPENLFENEKNKKKTEIKPSK